MPTFGSLFAGIGGMDLGLERAGWECKWQVEIDPWCQRVLTKHWPDVPKYGDVKDVGDDLGTVDLICGGFPCQPVSHAGSRKAQEDDRWLWPEYARVLGLLRPRYVLVENVPGLLNVNGGSAFGEVLGDLASLGYDAQWDCIPAAALGAPHLRYRVLIVAEYQADPSRSDPNGQRLHPTEADPTGQGGKVQPLNEQERVPGSLGEALPNGNGQRREGRGLPEGRRGRPLPNASGSGSRIFWPAARPLSEWLPEPDVGRVVDGVPSELDKHRIRSIGNAVVPQVAEWIGRRLMEVA